MSEHVRVEDVGGLRRVAIDRPRKANALSTEMVYALEEAFIKPAPLGVQAIHVSAAGKDFSAGGDLAELKSGRRSEQYGAICSLVAAVHARTLPLFVELHGKTLGAALLFPILADVVVAADSTMLGIPEVQFGMYPVLVHQLLLERLPYPLVFQLCIGARSLTAEEALSLGLVTEIGLTADFARHAAERTEYYRQRIDAVLAGRKLRSVEFGGGLLERTRKSEAPFALNLAAPSVQILLETWLR